MDTNLRISTMTQVGELNSLIDLTKLYENLEIDDKIKYISYGSSGEKGEKFNKIKNPRKNKEKKHFYNQITIHISLDKIINFKLFNNGRIQMTGIKRIEQGEEAVDILIEKINNMENKDKIIKVEKIECSYIKIANIVSDLDIGHKINREGLHRLMIDMGYYSSFESCIYPGVNIKYYYNEMIENNGICNCDEICTGKGLNGSCKKITIAVFNSGKALITGGCSRKHIEVAYNFITDIIKENEDFIKIK